ncbi:MAG TPA: DUF2586 family protein [Vicinamibacterales bacterium]|nr:DUF2586 family protein [Vicinamibacterales bacterium]
MTLPNVSLTVQQGLGGVPGTAGRTSLTLGIAAGGLVNTLYGVADVPTLQSLLGQGPLVEAMADKLTVAGGLQYAMPLNPSTNGSVGATNTTLVTGAATVTGSAAPAKPIAIKIILGGAIGTFTFAVSINGGAYSAPVVTTGSPFPYLVPGTLVKITFAAGTYVANDVYTISTLGVVTLVGSGPSPSNLTFTASPLDGYDVRIAITTAGAPGTGIFTYSVDGNNNISAQVLIPSGGAYAIPGTGVVVTFSGTFVAGDIYSFTTVTASYSASDVATALTAFHATRTPVAIVHVVGMGANAAAAATLAATVDSAMVSAFTAQLFEHAIIECPTSEADSALASAFANFSSTNGRIDVCAGDIGHISSATPGRIIRRNVATVYTSRLCATKPSEHPGWVGSPKGKLPNVASLYPNGGGATTWTPDVLDANRFVTARVFPGRGYYITRGNTMAPAGDDYSSVMNARVMNVASAQAIQSLQPFLNKDLLVNASTGTIDEREATAIEGIVRSQLEAVLVSTPDGGDATKVTVTISRTQNLLSTRTMPVTIAIVPKGYAENIPILIGLINPALAA